jgi:SAM-dependent methyltransferase
MAESAVGAGEGEKAPRADFLRTVRQAVKRALPTPAYRILLRDVLRRPYHPAKGMVDFGDLRRTEPLSRQYGYDRGRPIDRYYIESFLERSSPLIKGRVLEVGERTYTLRYGGDKITRSDVLHVHEGNSEATFVGDLADIPELPSNAFDCVIVTQTLQLLYDMIAPYRTIYRVLTPGGVLLATVPGITQIGDEEWNATWYWSFTAASLPRVAAEVFPESMVTVEAFGNVLAATSFLQGIAAEELTRDELDVADPEYPVTLTLRAFKPERDFRWPMAGRWDYAHPEPAKVDYGDTPSYAKGMAFLEGHGTIEDWGCGMGKAKDHVRGNPYVGIDGSPGPRTTTVADLQDYRSSVDCIFMRHVLEHNWGWRVVLANALASFRHRMVLILFTPLSGGDIKLADNGGIPDLSLDRADLIAMLGGFLVAEERLATATEYGVEHIFYLEKHG